MKPSAGAVYKIYCYVSIPKRVSEALKPLRICFLLNVEIVSIPKRVSEALKLLDTELILKFGAVSIPKRVSEALKQLLAS